LKHLVFNSTLEHKKISIEALEIFSKIEDLYLRQCIIPVIRIYDYMYTVDNFLSQKTNSQHEAATVC